jgi:hypothetical protein
MAIWPNEPCNCSFSGHRKWLVTLEFTNKQPEHVQILEDMSWLDAMKAAADAVAHRLGGRPSHQLVIQVTVTRVPNRPCPVSLVPLEEGIAHRAQFNHP